MWPQRGANFHGVWPWVLSSAIMRLPEAALGTSLFSIIVYFSVGFTLTAGRFFTYWIICFAMQCIGVSLFMCMGAFTGSDIMAQGLGAVVGIAMIATSGFTIASSECQQSSRPLLSAVGFRAIWADVYKPRGGRAPSTPAFGPSTAAQAAPSAADLSSATNARPELRSAPCEPFAGGVRARAATKPHSSRVPLRVPPRVPLRAQRRLAGG